MYQFSRSIYRELAPMLAAKGGVACESKQRMLDACESTMNRLVSDRRYFAKPTKALFSDLRNLFPIQDQLVVYRVVDRNVRLAVQYLDSVPAEELVPAGGRECRAHTRRGTPCQREPLPGRDYCPSHKHLEEDGTVVMPASAEAELSIAA
ncbi:MAG: hypothetical protein KDB58_06225 [Solirubrobacterales bacterium]|nr:hypothetical protein [Solirubrobacterales bacterium]MCB8969560.1 hypothetical protein [Thermoleophilales bacterium]MCO5326617.1 hypothetical protein [Solirubrobacterales bacterium]